MKIFIRSLMMSFSILVTICSTFMPAYGQNANSNHLCSAFLAVAQNEGRTSRSQKYSSAVLNHMCSHQEEIIKKIKSSGGEADAEAVGYFSGGGKWYNNSDDAQKKLSKMCSKNTSDNDSEEIFEQTFRTTSEAALKAAVQCDLNNKTKFQNKAFATAFRESDEMRWFNVRVIGFTNKGGEKLHIGPIVSQTVKCKYKGKPIGANTKINVQKMDVVLACEKKPSVKAYFRIGTSLSTTNQLTLAAKKPEVKPSIGSVTFSPLSLHNRHQNSAASKGVFVISQLKLYDGSGQKIKIKAIALNNCPPEKCAGNAQILSDQTNNPIKNGKFNERLVWSTSHSEGSFGSLIIVFDKPVASIGKIHIRQMWEAHCWSGPCGKGQTPAIIQKNLKSALITADTGRSQKVMFSDKDNVDWLKANLDIRD